MFYRRDNKKLKSRNEHLRYQLERAQRRLQELEEQHIQQGHLQEKMRTRIKQMDSHAMNSGTQVSEILNS